MSDTRTTPPMSAEPRIAITPRLRWLVEAYAGLHRRLIIFAYPVREMQSRGWIATTDDTEELADEMCRFFRVDRVEQLEDLRFPNA